MEKINTNLEKIFFLHILENAEQFQKVEPYFFKNADINFIYKIVRDDYLSKSKKEVPTRQQISAMVRLNDPEKKISDEVIKLILKGDNNTEYSVADWIIPRFKAWKLSNNVRNNIYKSVEMIRAIEEINYENVVDITAKIKNIFNEVDLIDDDDENLGDDFDDVESHQVSKETEKMKTGWGNVDTVMGGGWDRASLNCVMAQTSGGKSMFMQNMAVKLADDGHNVVYITLEMGAQKCFRRLGAMRLRIPSSQYNEKANDVIFMKNRINGIKNQHGGMFNFTPGKLFVKKYGTSNCTITDLDNYIHKFEEKKKIKIDVVFVDYLNLMSLEKGLDFKNNLFLKGKHLAEGLRYLADKHNCTIITATQTAKDIWNANDISLSDIPESKAIAETADCVWGIIRNTLMKKNNEYKLKILKLRDGENTEQIIKFDFDPEFLLMVNDELIK